MKPQWYFTCNEHWREFLWLAVLWMLSYIRDFRELCLLALCTAVLQKFNATKLPSTLAEVCRLSSKKNFRTILFLAIECFAFCFHFLLWRSNANYVIILFNWIFLLRRQQHHHLPFKVGSPKWLLLLGRELCWQWPSTIWLHNSLHSAVNK